MTEKKPAKPEKSIGNDPFADIADEVWQNLGVTPANQGAPDKKAASPEDIASKKAAPIIEIHDEADMALVAWLNEADLPPDKNPSPPEEPPAGANDRDKV